LLVAVNIAVKAYIAAVAEKGEESKFVTISSV
jgi:hypothetical protein